MGEREMPFLYQVVGKDFIDKVTKNLKEMREQSIGYLEEEHSRQRVRTCSTESRKSHESRKE